MLCRSHCPFIHSTVNIFSIALACALTCGIAGAQAAEPQGPAEEMRVQMLRSLHGGVAPAFVLDKDLPLDPALRAKADKLSAEHLERVDKLLPAWVDEERARQTRAGKAPASTAVYYAVLARLLNELSLWQLEPGDAHYESTTLAVLRSAAGVCDLSGDYRLTDFASRILRIQALPATEREAMLASERELLAHWGRPRAEPPPWPDPLPQQAAFALLGRGPADADHPRLALPPRLAAAALGFGRDYTTMVVAGEPARRRDAGRRAERLPLRHHADRRRPLRRCVRQSRRRGWQGSRGPAAVPGYRVALRRDRRHDRERTPGCGRQTAAGGRDGPQGRRARHPWRAPGGLRKCL
jgi:hypothetical protein